MSVKYSPEEQKAELTTLVAISREFGNRPEFVLAGGGNTSCKIGDSMFVKASGHELANIDQEGFVEVSLKALERIWTSTYPVEQDEREKVVLSDLMAARKKDSGLRPSVETLLHELFPHSYVVHTHPAVVNGLTCAQEGEKHAREIFGDDIIWIPVIDPGYILAKEVKNAIEAYTAVHRGKDFPQMVFLRNHGIFVAADRPSDIREIYASIINKISAHIRRQPQKESVSPTGRGIQEAGNEINSAFCRPFSNSDIDAFIEDRAAFEALRLSITPDHIVYSGYRPLFIEEGASIRAAIRDFVDAEGFPPKIVAVQGLAVFACADSEKQCELARLLFEDNVKIAVYSESFGGIHFMPEENINFIRNWEVEKYRASVSTM